jgi:hypothetical protein
MTVLLLFQKGQQTSALSEARHNRLNLVTAVPRSRYVSRTGSSNPTKWSTSTYLSMDESWISLKQEMTNTFTSLLHFWLLVVNPGYMARNVSQFRYLGTTVTNQNLIQEEIKSRLNYGNACYHSVQNLLSSRLLSKNLKIRIYKTIILPVVLYGCET